MPRFTGQNKKKIDPRYFLEEMTTRSPEWIVNVTWLGKITDDKNIQELTSLLAAEVQGDAPYTQDQLWLIGRVQNIFEQHAGSLVDELQRLAFEEVGLDDPLDETLPPS